ncbi:unnamed protein product [Periconia digitata]|uniref:Uncharacterized protein n=1 Tax=Periconia digitata TaxID=1303443 RepID=A0A9W4UHM8_9PLEO|nr:unnamed protein product [Periconia digitata]
MPHCLKFSALAILYERTPYQISSFTHTKQNFMSSFSSPTLTQSCLNAQFPDSNMKFPATAAISALAVLAGAYIVRANSFESGDCAPPGTFQGGDKFGNCIGESKAMNCSEAEPVSNFAFQDQEERN